jgi:Zn-dependent protease with chaperone function
MPRYPDIHSRAWEHPADRAALTSLRKVRGFDLALKQIIGRLSERQMKLLFLGTAVRVGPRQLPRLDRLLDEACEILDVREKPELFVSHSPIANAAALGVRSPFLIVNARLLGLLDDAELRCVLGHELGHVLSGHVLYKTMLTVLTAMVDWMIPRVLALAAMPLLLALREWERKAELSADRAGLLVAADLEVARSVVLKIAGGTGSEGLDLQEFQRQAREYEQSEGVTDALFKVLNLVWMSHPFPVLRVVELGEWHASAGYRGVLEGRYPRRSDASDDERVDEAWLEAARSYAARFGDSLDWIADLGRDAAAGFAENLGRWIGRRGEGRTGRGGEPR